MYPRAQAIVNAAVQRLRPNLPYLPQVGDLPGSEHDLCPSGRGFDLGPRFLSSGDSPAPAQFGGPAAASL